MIIQSNPYLIWQLLPGLILFIIGLYIQSRPVKKRESNVFSALMFSGSLWAVTSAIQLITPNPGWQKFWNNITFLGIMVVPTSWFLLAAKLTGFAQKQIDRNEKWFWAVPFLLYIALLTSNFHKTFFTGHEIIQAGGYAALQNEYGPLFYVHTAYSYMLLLFGMLIIGRSLVKDFKKYGSQAYGLIIGILAPLVGNIYYLFGSVPAGFPDPTPMIFTVTGVSFAWSIFGGHLLEVVPLAHDAIVRKLSAGIIILDAEKHVKDINPAAIKMLGLPAMSYLEFPFNKMLKENPDVTERILASLETQAVGDSEFQADIPETGYSLEVLTSRIKDNLGNLTGWLIQLNDVSEQKQAEANLVTARETLESVLDTLQDSYFESDLTGVITYANSAFCNRVKFSREEVIGKSFRHFTIRESIRDIYQKFNQVIETKTPIGPFKYNYRSQDGQFYIAESIVSPIIENGEVVGTRGLLRDITERLKTEREILEQKDLLDNLLQQSPLAMVINDKDEKVSRVNTAFESLFGYAQKEVLGKSLKDILSTPEILDEIQPPSNLGLSEQVSQIGQRQGKDGRMVDVEIFAAPLFVGGEQVGSLAFYHDITERLKAEAEREKTQHTYRAVLESLQDAYFEVLRTGQFVYVNQALCDWTGYSRDELLGRHFRIVASRKSIRESAQKHEEMFQTGIPIPPYDFIYRRKDKREFTGELMVSPIIDDGKIVGGRGIIRDVSVRLEAEDVLREAKEAAEYRAGELAAINRISETVSQSLDLNTILQSVCVELTRIFEIRNAGIGLLTPDKKGLEIVAFHSVDPEESSALGMILPVDGNRSSRDVLEKKKTIVIQNAQSDPRTEAIAGISRERGTKAIMIVPLLARGSAIGTIGMPAKNPDHAFTDEEVELAETVASQIAAAVDNAQLHKRTELALDIAERDLEIGRQIQSGFFPEKLPKIQGWEIATHFHAARQVAGDFYDVFKFKESQFTAFIIADVCDKGVGAALFMVLFRSLLRAFSEINVTLDNVQEQLLQIVLNTNNFIAQYHGRSNMFATLFFGILDPDEGRLYYVNGGHEPPVILDVEGSITQRLMPTGPAVGMFPGMEFKVEQIQIKKGDLLLGFTDGTTDAKDMEGNVFSEERLLESIAVPWTSTFSMLFELNAALKKHIGEQNQFDDITLISFRRELEQKSPQHAICREATLEELGEMRDFVETVGQYHNLSHDDIFAFKLVVDELCANIIQYGCDEGKQNYISLFFNVESGTARLTIRDDGKHFSIEEARVPDVEADWDEREIGGLGIYFVNELMDNVSYNRENGINILVLEKRMSSSTQ
jgi:PAS domain S-box-containing protein